MPSKVGTERETAEETRGGVFHPLVVQWRLHVLEEIHRMTAIGAATEAEMTTWPSVNMTEAWRLQLEDQVPLVLPHLQRDKVLGSLAAAEVVAAGSTAVMLGTSAMPAISGMPVMSGTPAMSVTPAMAATAVPGKIAGAVTRRISEREMLGTSAGRMTVGEDESQTTELVVRTGAARRTGAERRKVAVVRRSSGELRKRSGCAKSSGGRRSAVVRRTSGEYVNRPIVWRLWLKKAEGRPNTRSADERKRSGKLATTVIERKTLESGMMADGLNDRRERRSDRRPSGIGVQRRRRRRL